MKIFAVIVLFLASLNANALLDLRIGGGSSLSSPDLGSFYSGNLSLPTAAPAIGFNADIIFSPPLTSFGVGLRTESMKVDYNNSSLSVENKYTRTSLIVNYRLIDTIIFLGPIATLGLSHTGSLSMNASGVSLINITPGSINSYSIGLEAGAKLIGILVGAEVGYLDMRYKNANDSVSNITKDLNMSGDYIKLLFGFGF